MRSAVTTTACARPVDGGWRMVASMSSSHANGEETVVQAGQSERRA